MFIPELVPGGPPGLSADLLNQPFHIRSAVYDGGAGVIRVTIGPGRANFLGTIVEKTADTVYSISAPATNTTYYLYLKIDGTFMHNTTGVELFGAVRIGRITTGANLADPIARTDDRGMLPGAAARVVADNLADLANDVAGLAIDLNAHAQATQAHGASGSYRLAKTSRSDQLPAWADIPDKPATFPPSAHKSSHASGGSDALTPTDIGALPHKKVTSGTYDFNNRGTGSFIEEIKNNGGITIQNGPTGMIAGALIQTEGSHGLWLQQIAIDQNSRLWLRRSVDAYGVRGWEPWQKVWTDGNDGAGSGLDADLVRGRDVVSALDRNFYDDYEMHMELYYSGHHSGPTIVGMRGMTFDGFQDTNRVDTALTTAQIDTFNKCARNKDVWIRPVSAQNVPAGTFAGMTDELDFSGDMAWTIDGNVNTAVGCYNPYDSGAYSIILFDFGATRLFRQFSVTVQANSTGCSIPRYAHSFDAVNWNTITCNVTIPSGSTTQSFVAGMPFWGRYVAIQFLISGYATLQVREYQALGGYHTEVVYSTTKNLETSISEVVLYLTEKVPSGGSVVPEISADGGAHWESLSLVSSRADPFNSSYTEKKYTRQLQYPGSQLKFRATLNPSSDALSFTELKRYGIHWY